MIALVLALGAGGQVAATPVRAAGCEARTGQVDWDGDAGTVDWTEPTNWSGDTLPGPGSHVCIAVDGDAVSFSRGTSAVASVQVADGSRLDLERAAVLEVTGPEPSTFAALGILGGELGGTGDRTITGSAGIEGGTLSGSGTTRIAGGASLHIGEGGRGARVAIAGGHVLRIEPGATATWGPGPVDIVLEAPGRIENAGTLDITGDRTLTGSGTLANTGTLVKRSYGTTGITLSKDAPLVNEGVLEVAAGVLDVVGGGLENRGVLRIAASPALLRTSAWLQSADATLEIGVAGRTPFARSGRVQVAVGPVLDGLLRVVPEPGFAAGRAQRLLLMSVGEAPTGGFAEVEGVDDLPGGQPASVVTEPDGIVLVIGEADDPAE